MFSFLSFFALHGPWIYNRELCSRCPSNMKFNCKGNVESSFRSLSLELAVVGLFASYLSRIFFYYFQKDLCKKDRHFSIILCTTLYTNLVDSIINATWFSISSLNHHHLPVNNVRKSFQLYYKLFYKYINLSLKISHNW